MSPDTLRKLREWLTLKEAASELSTALSEDVDASDVLRLVIDGHLQLSIYLPAKTTARCRKLGEDAPDARQTRRTIDGVWDVPMVGRGKSQIEHDYQWQRAGLNVPKDAPVGALVEQDDLICQVPPDREESSLSPRPESEFPQGSVRGVRRPALEAFIRQHVPVQAPTADPLDRPLGQRERTTLLTIIAALAQEANVDVLKPVKSGQIISALIAAIGYEVAPNTVAGHLRTLRKTLFGETRETPKGE